MTPEDAKKVIETLLTADGGCQYCSASLVKSFSKDFPEFKEMAHAMYKEEFRGYDMELIEDSE